MTHILTKTTKAGEVIIDTTLFLNSHHCLNVTLAGQLVVSNGTAQALPKPQGEMTHVIYGRKVAIGLTTAEAEQISTALRTLDATLPGALLVQRRGLVADLDMLVAMQSAAYDKAHAQQDARAMTIRSSYDSQIADAEAAIAAFDATHPDVIAAIKAERDERVEANRWN